MNKYRSRIIALLLIPSLLADPSIASNLAVPTPFTSTHTRITTVYEQEAFALPARWVHSFFASLSREHISHLVNATRLALRQVLSKNPLRTDSKKHHWITLFGGISGLIVGPISLWLAGSHWSTDPVLSIFSAGFGTLLLISGFSFLDWYGQNVSGRMSSTSPVKNPSVVDESPYIGAMNRIKEAMKENGKAALEVEKLGIRLGVNGVALRHLPTGKVVLFIGQGSTGKAASAYHMIEGLPGGIEKGTWQLAAHWVGQMLFTNHRADELYYMQHPEYDAQPLSWTQVKKQNGALTASVLSSDIYPVESTFRVNAVVLFSKRSDVIHPTFQLTQPHSVRRRLFVDYLIKMYPRYDHIENVIAPLDLMGQPSIPFYVVQTGDHLIENSQFQVLVQDIDVQLKNEFTTSKKERKMAQLIGVSQKPLYGFGHWVGRGVALIALIFLMPIIGGLAFGVQSKSPGDIFFKQARLGFQGKPLTILKLRTMTTEDDPKQRQVTLFGKAVRPRGLDELPQLWMIVKGEMQWFGPRPKHPGEVDQTYIDQVLSRTRPGFISSGALKMGIGTSNSLPVSELMSLDIQDLEHWSLPYAIRLFFKTMELLWTGRRKNFTPEDIPSHTATQSLNRFRLVQWMKTARKRRIIQNFIENHPIEYRPLADTSEYAATPFPVMWGLFKQFQKHIGDLQNKKLLEIGGGDLRVSLMADYAYGMQATAVEKDPDISETSREILQQAQEQNLGKHVRLSGHTDAFHLSWDSFDLIHFFYTEPSSDQAAVDFRRQLSMKLRRSRPGTILAIVFTEAQLFSPTSRPVNDFPGLVALEKNPIPLNFTSSPIFYLQFYKASTDVSVHPRVNRGWRVIEGLKRSTALLRAA